MIAIRPAWGIAKKSDNDKFSKDRLEKLLPLPKINLVATQGQNNCRCHRHVDHVYIDKPLQKHTLIQTISRVNRVFDGKDTGILPNARHEV